MDRTHARSNLVDACAAYTLAPSDRHLAWCARTVDVLRANHWPWDDLLDYWPSVRTALRAAHWIP